ncbi:MAG: nicotinate-nucleotide--dimethylbenzimidazole phosphoribosyltransferase [Canidatus Methanoxibalbensis ujae]|nr:nicotinate-nucleotide--dimethylbenzimidazole phosphoribosyltransferase [Candidatus Methanoxibalbensis ujae]
MMSVPRLDYDAMRKARARQDRLTKPQGSLGFLEDLSVKVAGIKADPRPRIEGKLILTFAADHGVAEEGVSAYPQEVTAQMVRNFLRGGAAISVLARHIGAKLVVVDMGVADDIYPPISAHENFVVKKIAYGTRNMVEEDAMSREQAERAVYAGMDVVKEQFELFKRSGSSLDIVGVGDMGIANTTASSAIAALITGEPPELVTGRGSGLTDECVQHKIDVVKKAITRRSIDVDDPFDVLAAVGGFEIAGIAGAIIGAASLRIPVVIDGFIACAGALIAYKLNKNIVEHMIAGHMSMEKGHPVVLEYLKMRPILQLDMRLGEGTGAALAINIVEAACKILDEMATFEEAGVSER